jgi:Uma2 family endonuclease
MLGLEYLMFFGVPENKPELLEGGSRWCYPFASREEAEEHFRHWRETMARWKQVAASPIRVAGDKWRTTVAGAELSLYPRPIDLRFPMNYEAFCAIMDTWNRRDYWPEQPEGLQRGWDSIWDYGDVQHQLWALLHDIAERQGGEYATRCDIAISERAAVAPSACYYRPGREDIWVGEYFASPPDLVAEVQIAPARFLNRGSRREVYRAAGVPHLWLVEPAREEVKVYSLAGDYQRTGVYRAGDSFQCELFPDQEISVDRLFDTQSKRHGDDRSDGELPAIPEWILPAEFPLGLEYLFLLGHPQRRWEAWGNRARSMIAFGSAKEAEHRLDHFVTEACHWEDMPRPKVVSLADHVDQAEAGRFLFTRERNVVFCDVAIDARHYRELLRVSSERTSWDWGDQECWPI